MKAFEEASWQYFYGSWFELAEIQHFQIHSNLNIFQILALLQIFE